MIDAVVSQASLSLRYAYLRCQGKFDCLVFEMLYIKKFKPNLNVQTDVLFSFLDLSMLLKKCSVAIFLLSNVFLSHFFSVTS